MLPTGWEGEAVEPVAGRSAASHGAAAGPRCSSRSSVSENLRSMLKADTMHHSADRRLMTGGSALLVLLAPGRLVSAAASERRHHPALVWGPGFG